MNICLIQNQLWIALGKYLNQGANYFLLRLLILIVIEADLYRDKWRVWHPIEHINFFSVQTLHELMGRIVFPYWLQNILIWVPPMKTNPKIIKNCSKILPLNKMINGMKFLLAHHFGET